ncbi:MAG: flavin reductase family protein [Ruminococcaceae bacterium]|nr:flavin reductase family protein [Oscillospiraceae bacterium]
MTTFQEIQPKELSENTFRMIGDDWMLITAMDPETGAFNTMTASWGGFGVLFHKNVAYLFIRPQRYTKQFVDKSEYLTLSFFAPEQKKALQLCGTKSGKDCDKIKEAGLTPFVDGKFVGFGQASKIFLCRKLYAAPMQKEGFLDERIPESVYAAGDYHTLYVVEIEKILVKK